KFGNQKLKWELRQQGISDEIIKEEMQAVQNTEYDRAKALWERQFGAPSADRKERDRQIRYLASRGFSFSTISQVIKGDSKGYF
ncbi:MAG: recombination regulator RecX, partial [Burkholderiales bacterium]|nr:recombination regulator RecX [Burkholderiales bacterium]